MSGLQNTTTVRDPAARWPRAAIRIVFGIVWLLDAALKWLPGFRTTYEAGVTYGGQGQPGWLQPWFRFWVDMQRPNITVFVYLIAVTETVLGLALVIGFARKLTYLGGLAFSLLVWGVAEGFGGPYASGSVDIGSAIIYAVVFAALLGLDYYLGPDTLAADYRIEQRIGWWHRVAEVARPHGSGIGRAAAPRTRAWTGPAPARGRGGRAM
jgi:uncharacterized membrane protein YphA (DoxX/SURF4 family)